MIETQSDIIREKNIEKHHTKMKKNKDNFFDIGTKII